MNLCDLSLFFLPCSFCFLPFKTDAIHTASRVYRQKRSGRYMASCVCDGLGIRLGLVLGIGLVLGLVMVYRLARFTFSTSSPHNPACPQLWLIINPNRTNPKLQALIPAVYHLPQLSMHDLLRYVAVMFLLNK